jgi:hypothetical protein
MEVGQGPIGGCSAIGKKYLINNINLFNNCLFNEGIAI